jgi:ABC-type tungstate transport system substrate-binding protein
MVEMIRMAAVLIAAVMIGNWFMTEQSKNKALGLPWHRVYFTAPGMIVVVAILILPFLVVFLKR